MSCKLVSIVIPVYDLLYYTRQCIESIFRVTPEELFELIVVDNGSAESTREYLNSQRARVTCLTNSVNRGFARACNQGAEASRGDFVLFLNNDILAQPKWLLELLNVTEKNQDVGVVGNKLLFPDGKVQHCGIVFSHKKIPYQIYRGCPADLSCVNKEREFFAVTGACMLVQKSHFKKAGGFDESYVNGCEDVDLCLKVRSLGYRNLYTPSSVLTHFEGRSPNRHEKTKDNADYFYSKWSSLIPTNDVDVLSQDTMELVHSSMGLGYKNVPTGEFYPSPEELMAQAKKWFAHGETDKALQFFSDLLSKDPCNSTALKTLCEYCYGIKQYAQAFQMCQKLRELHPQDRETEQICNHLEALTA